jgi:threonine dehydratase
VIDPVFLDTPLYRCEALEPGLGCAVSIKLETANPVRSFKGRGTEVVASLLAERGPRAVVCASAGNLGQALAWSGRGRGLDVTVVASRFATVAKLDRIRALGATLELVDGDHELARERAADIARYDGIRLVEDSLDLETCEGAATIGLELVDNASSFDTILIALGGGALATGVGHVVKTLAPEVEVICVQPLGAPAMTHSWRSRRVVTTDSTDTIADGVTGRRPIRPGRPPPGRRRRRPGPGGVDHRRYADAPRPRRPRRRTFGRARHRGDPRGPQPLRRPPRRHHRVRQQRRRGRLPWLGRRGPHSRFLTIAQVSA